MKRRDFITLLDGAGRSQRAHSNRRCRREPQSRPSLCRPRLRIQVDMQGGLSR
jgi:hypothetical protein